MAKNDDYAGVLLERLEDKFDALTELVLDMRERMATKEDLVPIRADIKIMKAALIDTSRQVHDHERRITRLEMA